MKTRFLHLALVVCSIAAVLATVGCGPNAPQAGTPGGKLVAGAEKLAVVVAVDQLRQAVTGDSDMTPAEKQAALRAADDLLVALQHPTTSAFARAAWDGAKPLLEQYVDNPGKHVVISQVVWDSIVDLVDQYLADLEAQETVRPPTTQPAPGALP
jgi:hypothetical protein